MEYEPENSRTSIVATGLDTQHQPQQPSTKSRATSKRCANRWPMLFVIGQCTAVPAEYELPHLLSETNIGTTWSVSLNWQKVQLQRVEPQRNTHVIQPAQIENPQDE